MFLRVKKNIKAKYIIEIVIIINVINVEIVN